MSEYLYSFLYSYTERISEIKSDSVQTEAIWFLKDSIARNKDVINNLNNQGFKKYDIGFSFSIPHVNGVFLSSDSFGLDISSFGAIRVYDFNVIDLNIENKSSAPDDYTLLFDKPDDVLIFSEYLKNEFGIRLEESKMEAKKNFAFFNVLSRLLSFALVAFSIISIIFFILNLLLAHINRNKRNLGTLKAFGLANKHIILLYSSITFLLVTISFISAFILSGLLGDVLLDLYVLVGEINPENYITKVKFSNVDFLNCFTWFVVLPTAFIICSLVYKLYKITPGDLIYERK